MNRQLNWLVGLHTTRGRAGHGSPGGPAQRSLPTSQPRPRPSQCGDYARTHGGSRGTGSTAGATESARPTTVVCTMCGASFTSRLPGASSRKVILCSDACRKRRKQAARARTRLSAAEIAGRIATAAHPGTYRKVGCRSMCRLPGAKVSDCGGGVAVRSGPPLSG